MYVERIGQYYMVFCRCVQSTNIAWDSEHHIDFILLCLVKPGSSTLLS